VDVLEDDDERSGPGDRLEQPTHGPGGLLDTARRVGQPDRPGHPFGHDVSLLLALEEGRDRAVRSSLADDLVEGPERDALAVREAASGEHRGTALDE
jgi:hypothetical protein